MCAIISEGDNSMQIAKFQNGIKLLSESWIFECFLKNLLHIMYYGIANFTWVIVQFLACKAFKTVLHSQ